MYKYGSALGSKDLVWLNCSTWANKWIHRKAKDYHGLQHQAFSVFDVFAKTSLFVALICLMTSMFFSVYKH